MVAEFPRGESPQRSLAAGRRWTFGNVVLDESSLELFVAGQLAKIEHKPLEVLIYFLNHIGKVVTKDELHEALWPGRIPSESVLTRTISVLRQALGESRSFITTMHGFGYKFVADVSVATVDAPSPKDPELVPGKPVPWKPHWKFARKLGSGGTADAWLARHEKTHAPVVIKIARTGAALSSFRREVTCWRVIKEALGTHAPVAQILDWGLEKEPYYLEVEYVEGLDLESWVKGLGGFGNISLETRLEIVAQTADALTAAHSLGILHRDLKPSNILIATSPTRSRAPGEQVKLCDFGSGTLLDSEILSQIKITRADLTQSGAAAGTALYMAPELIDGQPMTARCDIYSLGVIFFQMASGSFQKTLAPGWESVIRDELLVADIRETAAGDPGARLSDARLLAERLRTLVARRAARQAEMDRAARAERLLRVATELKRARAYVAGLVVLASIALAGGYIAHRQSREAMKANATMAAVNAFLMDDVLAIDPSVEIPSKTSYQSLLEKASARIDERFSDQPAAAATLHFLLGRRFQEIGQLDLALPHYQKAAELQGAVHGRNSDAALLAEERYANSLFTADQIAASLNTFKALIATCERLHGKTDLSCLLLRERVARLRMLAGEYGVAEGELRSILTELPNAAEPTEQTTLLLKEWLGVALVNDVSNLKDKLAFAQILKAQTQSALGAFLSHYANSFIEAEQVLRDAATTHEKLLGRKAELAAENKLELSAVLAAQQKFAQAEGLLQEAAAFYEKTLPADHWLRAVPLNYRAVIRMNEGRWKEAVSEMTAALDVCTLKLCPGLAREELSYELGVALMGANRNQEAIVSIRDSLTTHERRLGRHTVGSLQRHISLAEALLYVGKTTEAAEQIAQAEEPDQVLPRPRHLVLGEYLRVQGLLALKSGDRTLGEKRLAEARQIIEECLGPNHWKTRRVADELKKLQPS